LIIENNFYLKNIDVEIKNNFNEINEPKKEKSIIEKEEIPLKKEKSAVEIKEIPPANNNKNEEKPTTQSIKNQTDSEKIQIDEEKKVVEYNKFIKTEVIEVNIPEIISMVIAKIISNEKTDNTNLAFESFQEHTWDSTSMGCPVTGISYAQVITDGYKISMLKNQEKTVYHTDLNGNYVNCSEILKSNINADFNFVKKYNLADVQKIELRLNQDDKIISIIEDKEKIKKIIESINININITQSESCDANYKLIFEKKTSSTEILVYCRTNPYYTYTDENFNAGETILNIVEDMLSSMEFPGIPK
jgi:hypothetical protein